MRIDPKNAAAIIDGYQKTHRDVPVYGICAGIGPEGARYKTGVPGLDILRKTREAEVGRGCWFRVTGVDVERPLIYGELLEAGKADWKLNAGDLCLGYVARIPGNRKGLQLTPRWFAGISNEKETFPDGPDLRELCAMTVDRFEAPTMATVVSTAREEKRTAQEPVEERAEGASAAPASEKLRDRVVAHYSQLLARGEPLLAYGVCERVESEDAWFRTAVKGLDVRCPVPPGGELQTGEDGWIRITSVDRERGSVEGERVSIAVAARNSRSFREGDYCLGFCKASQKGECRVQLTPRVFSLYEGSAREAPLPGERKLCAIRIGTIGEQIESSVLAIAPGSDRRKAERGSADLPQGEAQAQTGSMVSVLSGEKPKETEKRETLRETESGAGDAPPEMKEFTKRSVLQRLHAMLRAGRSVLVYGTCYSVQRERFRAWYRTGIPNLNLPRWIDENDAPKPEEGQWFRLTEVDLTKQFINGNPISEEDERGILPKLKRGDLCLGLISRVADGKISVQLAPKWYAEVTNSPEMLREGAERGTACAAVVEEPEQYVTAKVVSLGSPVESLEGYPAWLPEKLEKDLISLPTDILESIRDVTRRGEGTKTQFQEEMAAAYEIAYREHTLIVEPGGGRHISFLCESLRDQVANDAPMSIGLKPDKRDERGWHVEFAGLRAKRIKYVFCSQVKAENLPAMFRQLKDMALAENWNYGKAREDAYPILESYFYYTYYNVWIRKLFADSDDGTIRVFNTGLVDYRYERIYCVLGAVKQPGGGKPGRKWYLKGFAVPGVRDLGKELNKKIHERDLPESVKFITELKDLFIDTSQAINSDWEHILIDNINRLPPMMFLELAKSSIVHEVEPIVAQMLSRDFQTHREGNRRMQKYLKENDYYLRDTVDALENSVKRAWKRAEWNYKTAVPVYYAARNTISLLLPLNVLDSSERGAQDPDVALVVSKQPSGNYQGETIYTLAMAYLDSRLITRPDSDWLRPDVVGEDTEVDEEDLEV